MDIEQPPSGEDLPQATAHVDEESKDVGDGDGDAESSSSSAQGGRRKFNKYHNIRAHANPLSDNRFPGTPYKPDDIDWSQHYPGVYANYNAGLLAAPPRVEMADVGCGFGGLLVSLAPVFPDTLLLGLEIREKAAEYVTERIRRLREQHKAFKAGTVTQRPNEPSLEHHYDNISVVRCNAMKYFPCYFAKGQLSKMFILFPDPHFKKTNHRRRIVSASLLAEYAYAIRENGMLYTITDVEELHKWMVHHLEAHPLFVRIPNEELADDPAVPHIIGGTEEGKKVARINGEKYLAVYRRIPNPVA